MSSLATKIKAHADGIEKRPLTIPEWGVECVVFPMTVAERGKYLKLATDTPHEALLEAIVSCCRNKDGKRIFDHEDRLAMKHEGDPIVVERVALFVLQPYLATAEKPGEDGTGAETEPTSPD